MRHFLEPVAQLPNAAPDGEKRAGGRIAGRLVRILIAFLLVLPSAAAFAGEFGSRAMSGWFNVTTADGWVGRRYMDGQDIFAEEFDADGDGRIDVWRFYSRGLLTSEERDLSGDGKVNYQSRWESKSGRLLSVLRDTDWRGVNDLEIESTTPRRWEIREDRNQDGVTDRILFVNGPTDLFEAIGINLATQRNVIDSIPREYWAELWSDDSYTMAFTDYRRFSKGGIVQYGQWDGRRIVWRRVGPDFEPPVPPPGPAAVQRPEMAIAHGPNCPIPNCPEPMCRVEPSAGPVYTDPNYVPEYPPEGTAGLVQGFDPYPPQSYTGPGIVEPRRPTVSDRTRYDGLPPGDSAARSVPARMRMPGQGGTKGRR